jgi:hypothetical protein
MADRGRLTTNTSVETELEGGGAGTPYVTLLAKGTWGGGTLSVEAGFWADASSSYLWVPITDVQLTADGCVTFAITAYKLRVTLTGATAPSLDWALV